MKPFSRFSYASLDALKADIDQMGLPLPADSDTSILNTPVTVYGRTLSNRLAVHPMEGCDGEDDGSPSPLVLRRYERFARGGCALIWVEACAVMRHARANPRQLWLHEGNVDRFKALTEKIRSDAKDEFGTDREVFLVLQLTHSGRYSKPGDGPAIFARQSPYLDPYLPHVCEPHQITDEEIVQLEDRYAQVAALAQQAGFDAIDLKACHGYLHNELLASFTREGPYGGSFENRTRFALNTIKKIRAACNINITMRLNAFDEIPYPYGWDTDPQDFHQPDLTEGKRLIRLLYENGVRLINLTGGNPYYNPHVNRPYDACYYTPPVHQLYGVNKLLQAAKELKSAVPSDMMVISTGYSWLREFGANVAAGCIREGYCDIAGFGRQSFAYPDFAKDILSGKGMERKKCCIACGKCSEIMRNGSTAGCVIRDAALYAPIYKKSCEGKPAFDGSKIAEHV